MAGTRIREADLYAPVKRLLEAQGYAVKGEIGAADVVAVRGDEPPVVVELKAGFSLSLFHQAIARQAITDAVYVAIARGPGRAFLRALAANTKLCRRLGLGLITVRLKDGFVEVHCDPEPYRPRQSAPRAWQTRQRRGSAMRHSPSTSGRLRACGLRMISASPPRAAGSKGNNPCRSPYPPPAAPYP